MTDVFREVSEDLRREQLKRLWQRFGKYVIAAAVLIVVAVAGYQILQSVQARQSAESGDRYQVAADLYAGGELEAAAAAFAELAADGYGGYPTLALLSAAGVRAELGDVAGAIEALDAVAADAGAEATLRNVARVRAAYFMLDTAPLAEIRLRLEPFIQESGPFRVVALEIMTVSAIQAEEYDLALDWVTLMAQDTFANQANIARATALFSYILARRPTDEPAAGLDILPGVLAPAIDPAAAGFAAGADAESGFDPAAPDAAPEFAPVLPFAIDPLIPLAPGFDPAAN